MTVADPTPAGAFTPIDLGPAVEPAIAKQMVKAGVVAAPVLVLLGGLGWGLDGAASTAYAVAVVLVNFVVSAGLLATAARISVAAVFGAAMFGYLLRLGLVVAAVLLVKDQAWVELVPLCLALIATHLGLLFWEARKVSFTLAHPGAAPRPRKATTKA